jgi:hypothetical protein
MHSHYYSGHVAGFTAVPALTGAWSSLLPEPVVVPVLTKAVGLGTGTQSMPMYTVVEATVRSSQLSYATLAMQKHVWLWMCGM